MYCAVPRIGNILALVFLDTEDERDSGSRWGNSEKWVGEGIPSCRLSPVILNSPLLPTVQPFPQDSPVVPMPNSTRGRETFLSVIFSSVLIIYYKISI